MEHNLNQELLDTIDAFIKGQLKGNDLNDFEQKLNESPELRAEVELQRQLFSKLNESNSNWELFDRASISSENEINKEDYQISSDKIKRIAQAYKLEEEKKVIPLWSRFKKYGYAAAIVAILIVSLNLFKNLNSNNSYQYNHSQWAAELTSFKEKSDNLSPFVKAENAFRNKNYKSALELFNTIGEESKYYPYSLMYIGAIHDLQGETQEAIRTFDKLITLTDFEDSTKGLWYKAKIYLKTDQKNLAVTFLKSIVLDKKNAYYSEAQELLKELE